MVSAESARVSEREEMCVCADAISTKLHKNADVAVPSPAFSFILSLSISLTLLPRFHEIYH